MAAKQSRTTFAKLDRERKLREKRAEKKARKIARRENPEPAPEAEFEQYEDSGTPDAAPVED